MSKQDFREFISWRTAFNTAHRKVKETGLQQAVYWYMLKNKRIYKTMDYKKWSMIKPGTLVCYVQKYDKNLDGFSTKTFKRNGRLL